MFKNLFIIVVIIAVLAIGTAFYFYLQFTSLKENPQKISQEEAQGLIDKVGKLIVLPKDETPTIATVTDPDALKNQTFFANAQKGDKTRNKHTAF